MAKPSASAMVLCAGRGERMRPLTDTCPKPLLSVRGKPLLAWHLEALARAGHQRVLINTAWQEQRLLSYFGTHYAGLDLQFSQEGRDFGQALETAGGIVRTLPFLDEAFWAIAGDTFAPQFDFAQSAYARFVRSSKLAHLFLVPNPGHHPEGDFALRADDPNQTFQATAQRYTFCGIALYKKALFGPPFCAIPNGNPKGTRAPIGATLHHAFAAGHISTELYQGLWVDVGTPGRLLKVNQTNAQ